MIGSSKSRAPSPISTKRSISHPSTSAKQFNIAPLIAPSGSERGEKFCWQFLARPSAQDIAVPAYPGQFLLTQQAQFAPPLHGAFQRKTNAAPHTNHLRGSEGVRRCSVISSASDFISKIGE